MYLSSLRIENYRGIRNASLTFDHTTVLIGENDSGRTAIFEALTLVLGARAPNLRESIRAHHFHRPGGAPAAPIRVIVHLAETAAREWQPPARLAVAWKQGPAAQRQAWLEVLAEEGGGGRIAVSWSLRTNLSGEPYFKDDPELLDWVRRLSPVIWLRSGLTTLAQNGEAPKVGSNTDVLLQRVGTHFRRLITGDSTDLVREIEEGTRAAHECIQAHAVVMTGASLVGTMASEILGYTGTNDRPSSLSTDLPVEKLGMVLVLGAISQVGELKVGSDSRPILLVDNPESNLHPMTVAAVWKLLQRFRFQKVLGTHSGNLLANCPLSSIRRLIRRNGVVQQRQVFVRRFSREDLRRVSYHVRSRRASAMFARCWLLVEGESEFWIMPELARVMGVDLAAEGVVCVEFAQCGLLPLVKLAEQLGISWHVLTDGDEAGARYQEVAVKHGGASRATRLIAPDIEHCFWRSGYQAVIQRMAFPGAAPAQVSPRRQIARAIERSSKPFLALSLVDAVAKAGPKGVPAELREAIEGCLSLAREAPGLFPPSSGRAARARGQLAHRTERSS